MAKNTTPKWVENKKQYDKNYDKEKRTQIGCGLFSPRDDKRIATWKSITKKADFMRQVLDMYAAGEIEIK